MLFRSHKLDLGIIGKLGVGNFLGHGFGFVPCHGTGSGGVLSAVAMSVMGVLGKLGAGRGGVLSVVAMSAMGVLGAGLGLFLGADGADLGHIFGWPFR